MNAGESFTRAVGQALANARGDGEARYLGTCASVACTAYHVEPAYTVAVEGRFGPKGWVEVRPTDTERDVKRRYLVARAKLPRLRVFDKGPDGPLDRYTLAVVEPTWRKGLARGVYPSLTFSPNADSPQGVSMWGETKLGLLGSFWLGTELRLDDLDPRLREHVRGRLVDATLDDPDAWWNR